MRPRSEAVEELVWEIRRAFRRLAEAADRELEPLGIQAADRALLEFLSREQDAVSLSELARKYSLSRQHIQQTLRKLQDPSWVEETVDPNDRRAVMLRLSRSGRAMWRRIHATDEAFFRKLASALSPEPVQTATEILRKLREALAGEQP